MLSTPAHISSCGVGCERAECISGPSGTTQAGLFLLQLCQAIPIPVPGQSQSVLWGCREASRPQPLLGGRCWIAQVCSTSGRWAPLPTLLPRIGVARALSGATPGDTALPGPASTQAPCKNPRTKVWGEQGWRLLAFRGPCRAPWPAAACK